jgi:serine/threonine protein kinase
VIIEQMLLALDYLERRKVVHRDLKPDNVLINSIEDNSEYEIRIADFGFAVFTPKDQLLTHKCGTPGYVAPEMFTKEDGYSYKADVFSLGALFFNLLTGRYLFSGESMEQTLRRNVRCDISGVTKYI